MKNFKDNLLVQFSVVAFVIMVILAMIVAFVLIAALNRNIELTRDHLVALESGEAIGPDDPLSLEALTNQVDNLKWVTLAAIGGSFLYLYATLVYLVWEGWKTIVRQRVELETANAELEDRVAERVEQLREAMGEGQRRLDAFRTAAGWLGLEEVPEKTLQDLVDVSRELIGARFGVLSLLDSRGATGKFITSGFAPEKPGRIAAPARSLTELGLTKRGKDKIVVADPELLRKAHGLQEGALTADGLIGVPVVLTGGASGAFYLMEKRGGASFSIDDEELLNLFAVLAGVHLENLNLYEEVALERRTLAAIQSSMTEGLVVVDPAGQIMYLNGTTSSSGA